MKDFLIIAPITAIIVLGTAFFIDNSYAHSRSRAVQEAYDSCLDTSERKTLLEKQNESLSKKLDQCNKDRSQAYEDLSQCEAATKRMRLL